METVRKEWEKYAKKEALKNLYNSNQNVTHFLRTYGLLTCNISNGGFTTKILFQNDSEIIQIMAQFQVKDMSYNWTMPEELQSFEFEEILRKFGFGKHIGRLIKK
jgi:hypothetical protein